MAGNEQIQSQVEGLATLLVLGDEIRRLTSLREFAFFSTNETHRLIPYHTAYLWQKKNYIGTHLIMQSGTAEIDVHAPTNQWIKFVINKISESPKAIKIQQITRQETDLLEITENWPETLPAYLLWCPLLGKDHKLSGGLLFFREEIFTDAEIKMLSWLISSYQYTWAMLTKPTNISALQKLKDRPYYIAGAVITLCILFFPVHLSVLGTGTVVPKNPVLINAPMQGIIKQILVQPGVAVTKDQVLFVMDKTDLQSNADVDAKNLLLTSTKLRAVINEGFTNKQSNAEAPILEAQQAIDQAHLNYTKAELIKADVRSPVNGIVIYDNKDEWIGQPVRTGERILVVADPAEVALRITIPVTEMIKLEKGAEGDFFLYGQLNPLKVHVTALGYNAKLLPNRILGYQIEAEFDDTTEKPQIGSQGSTKIYGHNVPFIYYLFRRPIQTMRQYLGI